MKVATEQGDNRRQRHSFLELLTQFFNWLQIVASPLLAGFVIGFLVYLLRPDTLGMLLGFSIAVIGLIAGVIWATKVWKKKGTVHFMSRVMATPELDTKDEK